MTAITRAATRRPNDAYFTPSWATKELITRVSIKGRVLECCVGEGAIAEALASPFRQVWRNDVDINCGELDFALDAARRESWEACMSRDFEWVVTNPPFNQAALIVPLAYEFASVGIAMLLRLSYLEPVKNRGEWLNEHPPTSMIVLPRISFTGNGKTDSVTCAWMVWEKNQVGTVEVARNPKFVKVAK